jgi:hypothetical protein
MEVVRGNVDFQFPDLVFAGKLPKVGETPIVPRREVFAINKYSGELIVTKNMSTCRKLF